MDYLITRVWEVTFNSTLFLLDVGHFLIASLATRANASLRPFRIGVTFQSQRLPPGCEARARLA